MKRLLLGSMLLSFIVLTGVGCSSTKVERVDVLTQIDLSGEWNDVDATQVSKAMVEDCLERPWLNKFLKTRSRNPVVIVGLIKNRSDEHINTNVFTKFLERELLNSGDVSFVASSEERQQLREERWEQQQGNTARETMAQMGRENGADYIMLGSIETVKDILKNKYVVLYQVNLELIDLTSNKKVWIGQHQIKKSVKQSRYSL